MTLIMILQGDDYLLQISDRRLSNNGVILTDESNKATVIETDDARLVCGFTGLAKYNSFSTGDWILDALLASAKDGPWEIRSILTRFTSEANNKFANDTDIELLQQADRRLTFVFSGFLHNDVAGTLRGALVTNCTGFAGRDDLPFEPDKFVLRNIPEQNGLRIGYIGNWSAVAIEDTNPLNELLLAGKPANAVLGKALEVFATIARKKSAGNVIGGQLNSVVIPRDRGKRVECAYHVMNASPIVYSPNFAVLKSTGELLVKGGVFHAGPDIPLSMARELPPIVFPVVHRNAPCPCGSGKQYRKCHR